MNEPKTETTEAKIEPTQAIFMEDPEVDETPSIQDLENLWPRNPSVQEHFKSGPILGNGLQYGRVYEDEEKPQPIFSTGESFHNARTVRHIIARAIIKRDRKAPLKVKTIGLKKVKEIVGRPKVWNLVGKIPGIEVKLDTSVRSKRKALQGTNQSRARRILMWWADRKLTPGELLHILVS